MNSHDIIANLGCLNVSHLNHCLVCYFVLGFTLVSFIDFVHRIAIPLISM